MMWGIYNSVALWVLLSLILQSCAEKTEFPSASIKKASYDQSKILRKTFTAGGVFSETVRYDPRDLSLNHTLKLVEKPPISISIKQIERALYTEDFVQGGVTRSYTDSHPIVESGYLDLLIIIDDSQSMMVFQEEIKDRFTDLLGQISNSNWRIAVATTSSSCLRTTDDNAKILTRYDYDQFPLLTQNRFEQLINAGNTGNNLERGILMATEALTGDCGDSRFAWTRKNSQKAVLIISDEKNCGSASNEGCEGEEYAKAEYFLDRIPASTKVYGLLLFENNLDCPDSGYYDDQYPFEYEKLVRLSGGIAAEICQTDYSKVLGEISRHVSQFVKRRFKLTFPPNPGSLVVRIDGKQISEGFILIGTTLELTIDPGKMAKTITAQYKYGGDDIKAYFDLMENADQSTLLVYLNGEKVKPSDFQLIEGRSLKFYSPPQRNSKIEVQYRIDEELPRNFSLNWPELAEITEVFVGSRKILQDDYSVDSSQGILSFHKPPPDGAKIELVYQEPDAKQTVYQIPTTYERNVEDIIILDPKNPDLEVAASIDGNQIIFDLSEVWSGRELLVRIFLEAMEDDYYFQFLIPETTIPATITAKTIDGLDCNEGVELQQNRLHVYCRQSLAKGLMVDYAYVEGFTNIFSVYEEPQQEDLWRVFINGHEVENFIREEGKLIIAKEMLNPEDKIVVMIYPPVMNRLVTYD